MVKCVNREQHQPCFAVSTCLIVLGISMWASLLITDRNSNEDKVHTLEKLKMQLQCVTCDLCHRNGGSDCSRSNDCKKLRRKCANHGWRISKLFKKSILPEKCQNTHESREYVEKKIDDGMKREMEMLNNEMTDDQAEYLEKFSEQTNMMVLHWFPLVEENQSNATHWTRITNYERHRSTFSVSTGPSGSYEDGFAVLQESGLYHVYAKITFVCTEGDKKGKRVHMEVGVQIYKDDSKHYSILSEDQHLNCALEGGLVTLYQEGLFRLAKSNRVFLRYKVPVNVELASHNAYSKSYFGMHRTGTA
ncbi:uncharacterized protein LOC120325428 [Styela clava]